MQHANVEKLGIGLGKEVMSPVSNHKQVQHSIYPLSVLHVILIQVC